MRKIGILLLVVVLFSVILVGCASATPTASSSSNSGTSGSSGSTVADGKTLMNERCASCHSLDRITNAQGTAAEWQQVVDQMVQRGAVLSADEEKVLVQYLADNYK
jgi:Cytochrome c.